MQRYVTILIFNEPILKGFTAMFKPIFLAGLALVCAAFSAPAAPEPIVVVKQTTFNPTLSFRGVTGDAGLSRELTSILGACGWFDLVRGDKADFTLSGTRNGNVLQLTLEQGGVPVGAWSITIAGGDRAVAKHAVDAIIEKTFKELKVRGFCTSRIAFCAQTAPGVRNIYVCDIDGNNVKQVTHYNSLCVEPCWFPDGKSIGYSKYNRTSIDVIQTVLASRRSRVLSNFRGINAGAAISPNGRQMAVILSPDHKVDLYILPIGGGKVRRLTSNMAVEASPCWSPDGRQLAFVSDETGAPRIFIASLDGSGRKRLPTIGSDAVTPDWSSDGKIVYATRVNGSYTLAVYDLKSGKNERITEMPGTWESPAWAADNRHVVCKRSDGAKSALYVVDTWTGRARLLLSTPYNLSMPVWSPCAR